MTRALRPRRRPGSPGRDISDVVIRVEGLRKDYRMGAEEVRALRGVDLTSAATSTWPSWARPAPASPPS